MEKPVRYYDGTTVVRLGDIVTTRVWFRLFRKVEGRVVYVPGISDKHGEFEHHGLCWIGVTTEDGTVFGSVVLPETGCLQKSLKFVARDDSAGEFVMPDMQFPE